MTALQKSRRKLAGEAESSGEWEDGPDLPPPNINNFVRGDERGTNLSERDSFLHPLKALKAKSKEESKMVDFKSPDKSEQTYVTSKVRSMREMSLSESVNETKVSKKAEEKDVMKGHLNHFVN